MKLIRAVYLVLKNIAGLVCYYLLSFIFPRNKSRWIYGNTNGNFRDNSKYFFLFCNREIPQIEHVWISSSKRDVAQISAAGYKACYKFSVKGLYYVLTAKVFVYNMYTSTDIFNGCLRGNAFLFNFWHGVPYKKIEFDITTGPSKTYYHPYSISEKFESYCMMEPRLFRDSSAILATSEKLIPIYLSAFQLKREQIMIGPYPRNAVFQQPKQDLLKHIALIESENLQQVISDMANFKKVIIYMPTWRDSDEDFMSQALPNLNLLQQVCEAAEMLFLIKAHPRTRFNANFSNFANIQKMDNNIDVYPLLPLTDALISDYSSIIFDYALLQKKIFFYAFDKTAYLQKSREAYFEYEEVFSHEITGDFNKLLVELKSFGEGEIAHYQYPAPLALHNNDASLMDIADYIKGKINYN